jgi:hypothetical protein
LPPALSLLVILFGTVSFPISDISIGGGGGGVRPGDWAGVDREVE